MTFQMQREMSAHHAVVIAGTREFLKMAQPIAISDAISAEVEWPTEAEG